MESRIHDCLAVSFYMGVGGEGGGGPREGWAAFDIELRTMEDLNSRW